jgi:hypothetical protein
LTALSVGAIVIVAAPVTMSLAMIALPSPEVFDKRAHEPDPLLVVGPVVS